MGYFVPDSALCAHPSRTHVTACRYRFNDAVALRGEYSRFEIEDSMPTWRSCRCGSISDRLMWMVEQQAVVLGLGAVGGDHATLHAVDLRHFLAQMHGCRVTFTRARR